MLRFKLHHLFAVSLLVTGLCHHPAQAMGVQFDLAGHTTVSPSSSNAANDTLQVKLPKPVSLASRENFEPLPIPPAARQPPINTRKTSSRPPSNIIATTRVLTPPPAEALPTSRVLKPNNSTPDHKPIAISFKPAQPAPPSSSPQPFVTTPGKSALPNWIYEGGSDSLIARVIGSAEGTRTASGSHTRAYYGHTDPGNGVWNMGTFSYQHGASSPQEADQKQLKRLKKQGKTMTNQANQAELAMTLGEILNGLDLANQSPRAALERGGYVDRLVQARKQGMDNSDAIVWARTYSYLDPDTQRWNAPGLGNTLQSIQRDQNRRHDAVARAFNHYHTQREKTDKPLEEALATPTVALVDQPVTTTASPENRLSEYQKKAATKPIPAVPLEFKVAESLQPTNQNSQDKNESITTAPNLSTELSQTTTTNSPRADSSQANANHDVVVPQIHS